MTGSIPAGATGGGAAQAAALARAVKASGAIVKVEPRDFQVILDRLEAPLVVVAEGWLFGTVHKYLTGYKGLIFYAQSGTPLPLPDRAEVIRSKKIWIPR